MKKNNVYYRYERTYDPSIKYNKKYLEIMNYESKERREK